MALPDVRFHDKPIVNVIIVPKLLKYVLHLYVTIHLSIIYDVF